MIRLTIDLRPMPTTNMEMSIYNPKTKRNMVVKTQDARNWMKRAVAILEVQKMQLKLHTIEGPVAMSMDVWRGMNAGDLGNFYKGVEDALQKSQIVRNDKLIVEHRRCRILTDARRPRYEIILWPLEAQGVLIPLDADPGPTIPDVFKLPGER